MAAYGLALSCPAISGAVPCTGSYRPGPSAPRLADGSMPSEPASTADLSLRMSPNRFSVTTTSMSRGWVTRCMANELTSAWSSVTDGNSGAMPVTVSRHSSLVMSTLALSTDVRWPRRSAASANPTRATRSISARLYAIVSTAASESRRRGCP